MANTSYYITYIELNLMFYCKEELIIKNHNYTKIKVLK